MTAARVDEFTGDHRLAFAQAVELALEVLAITPSSGAGIPSAAAAVTIDVFVELARARVGDLAVIRAFARAERATPDAALRSIARRLAAGVPDARFVEFADCGHVTYAEQPDQFAHAVSVFAAEVDRWAATSTH